MGSSLKILIPVRWGGEWVTRSTVLESPIRSATAPEDDGLFVKLKAFR
jgi:hypothetical protein